MRVCEQGSDLAASSTYAALAMPRESDQEGCNDFTHRLRLVTIDCSATTAELCPEPNRTDGPIAQARSICELILRRLTKCA